jgi:hypothetical protein
VIGSCKRNARGRTHASVQGSSYLLCLRACNGSRSYAQRLGNRRHLGGHSVAAGTPAADAGTVGLDAALQNALAADDADAITAFLSAAWLDS